jgi:hypothetical protein
VPHPAYPGLGRTRFTGALRTVVRQSCGNSRRGFRLSPFRQSGIIFLNQSNFVNDSPTLFIETPSDDRASASVCFATHAPTAPGVFYDGLGLMPREVYNRGFELTARGLPPIIACNLASKIERW